MSASQAIRSNIRAKPAPINKKDSTRDRSRKINEQRSYNREVSNILLALIGEEDETGRRRMSEDFIVEIMSMTDAAYRRRISTFMKVFNSLLKQVERVKSITSQLGRNDIIYKDDGDDRYYLTRGWDSELIKSINFFLSHSIRLLTINRKKTRAPTGRNQYRYIISDAGRDILIRMAEYIDRDDGELAGVVEEFTRGRVTHILITTLIRNMISRVGYDHLHDLVDDSLLEDINTAYALSKNVSKDGSHSVVIANGRTSFKNTLVANNLRLADNLIDRDGNKISFTTIENNALLKEVMNYTINASVEIVEGSGKTKSKVGIFVGSDEDETTIGEILALKNTLEAQLLQRGIGEQEGIIGNTAELDNADKIRVTAKSNISNLRDDITKKTSALNKKASISIASGITSIVGDSDTSEERTLTEGDIDNNRELMSRIGELIGKNQEDQFVIRFLDDVIKKSIANMEKGASSAARTVRRGQRANMRSRR